jgi:hypothetical protein
VFFKTVKHLLNLEREMQVRDYDAIIGHTTLFFCRFLFVSINKTLGTVIEMMRMILAKHHKNNGLSTC